MRVLMISTPSSWDALRPACRPSIDRSRRSPLRLASARSVPSSQARGTTAHWLHKLWMRSTPRILSARLKLSPSRRSRRIFPRYTQRSRISNLHDRSEEHTSELQSLMRISYAVFCLKQKKNKTSTHTNTVLTQYYIHNHKIQQQ